MATSIIEKYEQIFAADPRSRIFVELARGLLERGDAARAIDVCRTGLEHHPSSILGRVIWGRALLDQGDRKGAQEQFQLALALDPTSPYAFNLVGEALITKGLFRAAIPVLTRAVALQPADERVRSWLEQAKQKAQANGATPAPSPAAARAAQAKTPAVGKGPAPVIAPAKAPSRSTAASAPTPAPAAAVPLPGPPPLAARPVAPPPLQSTLHRDEIPRSLLAMIPGATQPSFSSPAAAQAPPPPDDDETERITARYAQEVRERLLESGEPAPSFLRRHGRALGAVLLLVAIAGAGGLFLHLREAGRGEAVARAAAAARAGLARDTVGSLREAAQVLTEARKGGTTPELTSLAAQVEVLLAVDHGDEDARALAAALARREDAGDGGVAAAYLLAKAPKELVASEAAVLAAPAAATPLVQELAGRILLKRGDKRAARERFELAARAQPPSLRALADLGDLELAAGNQKGALGYYAFALPAQASHARSVIGTAEARLALGEDLARSRADLEALEASPATAVPPALRVRYEVAVARVLFASGDPAAATARLARASSALGEHAALAATAAEIHLAARAYDRAEATAARAVALQPGDAAARVLLARARIGRGKYAEALAATGSAEGRAIWLQRGIARYRLGQYPEALRELARTAPSGHMPPEAVVWYALARTRLGRGEEALALLESLSAGRNPPPLTWVALGEVLARLGRAEEAERAWRTATEREPGAPEAHAALGLALEERGAHDEAVVELQKALAADPSDLRVRYALGAARLATGHPALARAELDAVLLARPADLDALGLLSAAWLAEGEPREARRAADRGLARAPGRPSLLLAAGRAALAQGERATAKALADRAVKAAGRGPDAAAARAFRASLKK